MICESYGVSIINLLKYKNNNDVWIYFMGAVNPRPGEV